MDERNENIQPAFTASKAEKYTALFMYIAAYIYTLTTGSRWQLWLTVFVALFVLMVEYLDRGVQRSKESWVWLGCAVLVTACAVLGRSRVWGEFYSIAAVHILAVWWALSLGGKLIEGESGHLLPLDALNGFVRIPFGNFSLRLRCIGAWIKDMSRGRRSNKNTIIASLTAIVLGVLLLWWAASSLASADSGFGRMVSGVLDSLRINLGTGFWNFLFRLAVSLPVGAYVFGDCGHSAPAGGKAPHAEGRCGQLSLEAARCAERRVGRCDGGLRGGVPAVLHRAGLVPFRRVCPPPARGLHRLAVRARGLL